MKNVSLALSDIKKKFTATMIPIGGSIGIAADIVSPIAPLSIYIFALATVASLALGIVFFLKNNFREKIKPALSFSLALTIVSGIMTTFAPKDQNTGLLASIIPAVQKLQKSIGIIEQDIAQIKKKTAIIEKNLKENNKGIKTVIRKIDDFKKGVEELKDLGGIVKDPSTPAEYYHNAKLYEERGDLSNARSSYILYAKTDLNFADPIVEFAMLLRSVDGPDSALETFEFITRGNRAPATLLGTAMLKSGQKRKLQLRKILAEAPDYLPVIYYITRDYSSDDLSSLAGSELKEIVRLLETFTSGSLTDFYLDKSVEKEHMDNSILLLSAARKTLSRNKIGTLRYSANRSNAGWTLSLNFGEEVKKIEYSFDEGTSFKETGSASWDRSIASPMINLPGDTIDPLDILVRYVDIAGNISETQVISFSPKEELMNSQIDTLKRTSNIWISFRDLNGDWIFNWSHILIRRCGAEKFNYSYGEKDLTNTISLPECDYKNPMTVSGEMTKRDVVLDTHMYVQITFRDGSKSDIVTFPTPAGI